MDVLAELKLHVDALATVVDQNPKFFVAVRHYVSQLRALLDGDRDQVSKEELHLLAEKLEDFWQRWRPSHDSLYLPPRETADSDAIVQDIGRLVHQLVRLEDASFAALFREKGRRGEAELATSETNLMDSPCVFIGHGGSQLWARLQLYLEDDLNLAVVTYESEPRTGQSIVPILERMLNQATFATLVLTAEDDTADGGKRARQNVVHEAGLFQGRLGFQRAILLKQDGVEEFTNVAGLQHIPFSGERIDQTFYELQRVLRRENQIP